MNTPSTTSSPQREIVFDALKLFAIFLVLWGHAIQYLSSTAYYDQPVYRYIYSFHMPLFMAIAGYFSNSARNISLAQVARKRFMALVYPALTFGAVFLLSGTFKEGLSAGIGKWLNAFWFLKSAFCCAVIFFACRACLKKSLAVVIVSLALSQCIFVYRVNLMYPCFLFGVFLNANIALLRRYALAISTVSGLCYAGLLCFWGAHVWHSPYVSMSFGIQPLPEFWLYTSYRIVTGLAGSLFFISLFLYVFSRINLSDRLLKVCTCGQETLGIYIMQTFLLETLMPRLLNLDGAEFFMFNFILTPLISLFVLVACIVMFRLIRKSSVLSLLLLYKKPTTAGASGR